MLEDHRFTDTISRNTSVQSAIERFDQRRVSMIESSPKSNETSLSEGTTNRQHHNHTDLAPPVPRARKVLSLPESPPQREFRLSTTSPSEPFMFQKQRSKSTPMNPNVLLHSRDASLYPQMKFSDQRFRPTNYGAGITGVYQEVVYSAASEDDRAEDKSQIPAMQKETNLVEADVYKEQ
ncbi:unnamed protein product, partial [Strongylus vulgaris]